ncbi:ABC transporter permease [Plantactinospora soyae]|uniref:ABC3 transporter permease C-terminal domain-containing protein n=1 Tax=Plantactinospora soyae TaxID=1544732 RepID=A0A927M2S1_9ACTN|nr:ABC transporter permease [Plantactinospora soyae]MBE1485711.1 hypothetical protein [Plantactinospora soyae]
MLRFVWRQLRGHAGRSVALLTGILVATTGFTVLTGTTTASRLQVTGTVERNTAAAYDILVRAGGSRSPEESVRGLVRPNYLSGLFGGITTRQYDQVKAISGVDVAAPIAMLGYSTTAAPTPLDLTDTVDPALDRQVIRVEPTFVADRGLSTAPARPRYVYVTRHPLIYPVPADDLDAESLRYSDGRSYDSGRCGPVPREVTAGGRSEPVCDPSWQLGSGPGTMSERETWSVEAVRLLPDGRFESWAGYAFAQTPPPVARDRLVLSMRLTVPALLAAVDPVAEERLVGLGNALVDGQPLDADDTVTEVNNGGSVNQSFPVLATNRPYVDGTVRASYTRLTPARVAGVPATELGQALDRANGVPAGTGKQELRSAHQARLSGGLDEECCYGQLQHIVQPGQAEYDVLPDGSLRAHTFPADPDAYNGEKTFNPLPQPWLAEDTAYRPLTSLPVATGPYRVWRAVGVFDPERLAGFSDVSRVPLETYEPPAAEGADPGSRQALGNQPLLPNGSPGGYLSAPPLLLTNLALVPKLLAGSRGTQLGAPISAIRVRVTDVDGYTERSAERVRLVAERIAEATGLDVDITLGSSPAPQTVELPAGSFGRPALRLTENWSALGVASVIISSVDRKSVLLFLLVLVVCALFLTNAVSAAVRHRRSELAVLACLGWPARRIGALILGEVALLGLVAGTLSVGLAPPLSAALDIGIGWRQAALAVPVALLLALVAGVVPALVASRAHPAAALRPAVTATARIRRPRTLFGLALVNLTRTPGRTLLGTVALALGVGALTLVAAAAYAFRGAIIGSLLGDVVSLSVRGADTVAAIATVLLGAAAVADVLYLNIRDRAAEFATLRAVGWTDAALTRLVAYEGVALGVLGAVTGAAVGLAGAAVLVGGLPGPLVVVAAATALGGALIATLAALVPATLLRRLPTARLLAQE